MGRSSKSLSYPCSQGLVTMDAHGKTHDILRQHSFASYATRKNKVGDKVTKYVPHSNVMSHDLHKSLGNHFGLHAYENYVGGHHDDDNNVRVLIHKDPEHGNVKAVYMVHKHAAPVHATVTKISNEKHYEAAKQMFDDCKKHMKSMNMGEYAKARAKLKNHIKDHQLLPTKLAEHGVK
jgi:hypothetical protein